MKLSIIWLHYVTYIETINECFVFASPVYHSFLVYNSTFGEYIFLYITQRYFGFSVFIVGYFMFIASAHYPTLGNLVLFIPNKSTELVVFQLKIYNRKQNIYVLNVFSGESTVRC